MILISNSKSAAYSLTGPAGEYLIVAPEGIGPDVYLQQKKADDTLQLTDGEWP